MPFSLFFDTFKQRFAIESKGLQKKRTEDATTQADGQDPRRGVRLRLPAGVRDRSQPEKVRQGTRDGCELR